MALTLQQLSEMSPEEIRARFADSYPDCGVCHRPIEDEHPDEIRRIEGKGMVHEDCYWGDLSDLMEKHPPGFAGVRRG